VAALDAQLPLVDLAQMHEEVCLRAERVADQLVCPSEEIRIAEQRYSFECVDHARFVTRPFSHSLRRSRTRNGEGTRREKLDRCAQENASRVLRDSGLCDGRKADPNGLLNSSN